ncbi:MAG: ELM1/GtrOC1 family putative glycosyltransferase, partial [Proteobacteria bacterium]|nr:ELM1/GtrOC1 family putative glycosyltransferase [Pseudomonadota bacterium]
INNLRGIKNKNKNKGLILLGGLSKHFEWSNDEVVEHINKIIFENQSKDITIFDSRRTPKNFLNILKRKLKKPIEIVRYKDKESDLITKKMEYAKYIWVTEDSLSMIYESIAVGSEVTCINLKKKTNKLRDITNHLFEKKKINFFQTKNRKLNLNLSKQSVADECTKLFIEFFKIK